MKTGDQLSRNALTFKQEEEVGFDRSHHHETLSFPAMRSAREEASNRGRGITGVPRHRGLGRRKCAQDALCFLRTAGESGSPLRCPVRQQEQGSAGARGVPVTFLFHSFQ